MKGLGFYVGNRFIAYYGICICIGILAASILAYIRIKKENLDYDNFILLAACSTLAAFLGGKIFYFIIDYKYIDFKRLSDLKYLSNLLGSGFIFYGSLLGALIFFYLFNKFSKIELARYSEACVPCIPLLHAFGRIGCHTVGCCYGIKTNSFYHIQYKHSLFAPNNINLFPVQITESILNFLLCIFLIIISKKLKNFQSFFVYLISYGIIRFSLEFFRGDKIRGIFNGFSTSQYISVVIVIFGVFFLIQSINKIKKGI